MSDNRTKGGITGEQFCHNRRICQKYFEPNFQIFLVDTSNIKSTGIHP